MAMIQGSDPRVKMIMDQRAVQKFFNKRHELPPNTNKRDINQILDSGAWAGRRCFIIAGSPSVADHDLSVLQNELTIGINRVYETFYPTILFAMDGSFHKNILQGVYGINATKKFEEYQGLKLWMDISNHKLISDVFFIRGRGRTGVGYDLKDGLFHGNNSGFGALNLAIALRANPIYLIGYDMKFRDGKSHYHDGHHKAFTEKMMKSFTLSFDKTAPEILRRGFKVINITKDSNLNCFKKQPELPPDLCKTGKPVYVSFYTKNTIYEDKKDKLIDSLLKHTLQHFIQAMPSQGEWIDNVRYKPYFIKKMMIKYPNNPIVWIDVDAEIKAYPVFFDNIKQSFSAYFRSRKNRRTAKGELEMLSGTLYFKNNDSTRRLIDLWIEETRKNPTEWDQKTLRKAFDRWDGSYRKLDSSYCCIYDGWERAEGVQPVIEHFQASREVRRQQWRK